MKVLPPKIRGIDSIRFLCALWVVLNHFGRLPFNFAQTPGFSVSAILNAVNGSVFDGPAAVIVFFVISGFCIHYPYRQRQGIPVFEFLCRRYLRIGLPMLAAGVLASWLGVDALLIQRSSMVISLEKIQHIQDSDIGVIWSLVCELIYYGLYPLLFRLIRRFGWRFMLGTAYLLAFLVIFTRPTAHSYPAYGNLLTWCLGLPCWLLGVRLAETIDSAGVEPVPQRTIWIWRFAVWAYSSVALLLKFHTVIGYPWTLTVFGPLCYFWLTVEMRYFRTREPVRFLEWAGSWSYSIYLGHKLVLPLLAMLGVIISAGPAVSFPVWGLRTFLVLVFCLVFYWLFEYPSHWLARFVGKKIAQTNA